MTLRIGGMGWVTPLGSGIPEVWQRLLNGDVATADTIASPLQPRTFQAFRVPASALTEAPAHPRLRRSSFISRFAVVAGLAALKNGGVSLDSETAERTALIFAISNGGVIYTKRFYHDVVATGAQAASPLLFPETVFNAPASHLAAILGITGVSYTLVGDGAVGLLALKMAEDLMANDAIDRCLVVGAEEADWLLCDAYDRWRLLRDTPPLEPFQTPARGMVLSEGAGAILLDRVGAIAIEKIDAGCNFEHQREAAECVDAVIADLGPTTAGLVVASANGTFIDAAERAAFRRHCPSAKIYAPKAALGESAGASSLWQVICAAQALLTQALPSSGAAERDAATPEYSPPPGEPRWSRAIVSTCGLNQQVAGLSIARAT